MSAFVDSNILVRHLTGDPPDAELLRAAIGFQAIVVADEALLLRALELYEHYRIHFAESYVAACAELSGVGAVVSFERVPSVQRLEPAE